MYEPPRCSDYPDFERTVQADVAAALAEDVGAGDISAALIPADKQACAQVITRDDGIFCGRLWVEECRRQLKPELELDWKVQDGEAVVANTLLFTATGPARTLLTLERTMLNFVQLLSGTATRTHQYAARIRDYDCRLLDTRKTIPGLRLAQKYAVRCGGGHNHRLGLFDAFLIKENHIEACGGISQAVAAARELQPDSPVEIEVESLEQLQEALAAGADIALLDNFSLQETRTAVDLAAGNIALEASGGIEAGEIAEIAATGVDCISVGDLTKTVEPLDLSMRIDA